MKSTGRKSIEFIRKTQMNTVSASGPTNLRECALWTIDLAWLSTISSTISMAAWKRPGTPDVARLAARYSSHTASAPIAIDQNSVSKLITEKSMMLVCSCERRCCRWCWMYSPAVGPWEACSAA